MLNIGFRAMRIISRRWGARVRVTFGYQREDFPHLARPQVYAKMRITVTCQPCLP